MPQPTERLATRERLGPTRHRAMVRKTQPQAERRETAATACLVDGLVPRTQNSFLIRRPGCQRFPTLITSLGVLLTSRCISPPPPPYPAIPLRHCPGGLGANTQATAPFPDCGPRLPADSHLPISELFPKHSPAHRFAASKWGAGGTYVLESGRRVGETTEAPQYPRRSRPYTL